MYRAYMKPFADKVLSLTLIFVLSPLLFVLTLILMVVNSGRPFFMQARSGRDGRIFYVIKFKTMNDKRNVNGELLPDAERLTIIGRFIRNKSLDELPQFLNVLFGDMSFVGPRPLLVEYLDLYNSEQARRHEVRPGITGWAQVNGRNAIEWKTKFELDVWYVDNQSFSLDVKILLLTVKKVFASEGVSAEGQATVEYFKGNEE